MPIPILLLLASLPSRSIHVSSVQGDDSRSIEQVAQPSTPWKTLGRAMQLQLQPGDSLLLRRNDVFHEILSISATGYEEHPIVIAAYGSGVAPILDGSDSTGGWTPQANNLWSTAWPSPLPPMLYEANRIHPMALWPVSFNALAGMGSKDNIVVGRFPASDLGGAMVLIRTTAYSEVLDTVFASSDSTLKLHFASKSVWGSSANRSVRDSQQYRLTGHPSLITKDGQWVLHNGRLWMRSRTKPVVEATSRKVGIKLSKCAWIRVQDIRIRRFSDFGMQVDGEHVLLEKLTVEEIGQSGLHLAGPGWISVHNCDLKGIASNGIESYANNVAINGGSIRRISVTPGWLGGSRTSACATGITVRGASSSVRGVRLDSIGYDGIKSTGLDAVISGNTITNFCLRLEDGGGIYLSGDKARDSHVDSNRISNPRQETPERDMYLRIVAGIYMDENTKSCHLGANTIDGGGRGIFLHNSAGNQVVRNTIHGYAYHGIAMEEDAAARDSLRDNAVIGNRTGGGGVSLMRLKKPTSKSSPGDFHGNVYEVTRAAAVFSLDDLTRNRWGSATWAQWSERGFDKDAVFLPTP